MNWALSKTATYASPSWPVRLRRWLALRRAVRRWRVTIFLMTHPGVLRPLFRFLRWCRPIASFGSLVIATRHDDVTYILSRDPEFHLAEFSEERMQAGDFLLNNDWPLQHDREERAILEAFKKADHLRIRTIARNTSNSYIQSIPLQSGQGRLDAVDLAKGVALAIVEGYFGVPDTAAQRSTLFDWLTDLAAAILALPPKGTVARSNVAKAADNLTVYLDDLVATRKANIQAHGSDNDTVLDRLIEMHVAPTGPPRPWLSEAWIRRMIAGLIIFGAATIVRAAADSLYEILILDREKLYVIHAAKRLAKEKISPTAPTGPEWDKVVRDYVYEALRFRPMLPILFRYAPRATIITNSEHGGRVVSGGQTVVAPPLAAMFDKRVFPAPGVFRRRGKNLDDYMIFGRGMHKCIGRHIAECELIEIVAAVLAQPNIRLAKRRNKALEYDGVAAKSFVVLFG